MEAAFQERRRVLLGTLFAEDFDTGGVLPAAPAEPPPAPAEPSYGAAELQAAREEGCAAGRTEAERGLAASRAQILGLIAGGMADARAGGAALMEQVAERVAQAMLGALAACLPALCRHHGEVELRALAQAVLPSLAREPRIGVHVHPLMAPAMAAEVATLDPDIARCVVVVATEAIAPGDARLAWQDGWAARDAKAACDAVGKVLAELGLLEQEGSDA